MRLSRIWRILQIKESVIDIQRPKAEVDNTLQDLQNSSYPTKAEFSNCFIVHSKYFLVLRGAFAISLFVFPLTKYKTTLSPGFLGQRFNNLQRAALSTSFWRHGFNNFRRAVLLTSLVQYLVNSSWLWWIMRVGLTNQKRGNILN